TERASGPNGGTPVQISSPGKLNLDLALFPLLDAATSRGGTFDTGTDHHQLISRAAVAIQKVIDPRTGPLQGGVSRRYIRPQLLHPSLGFGAVTPLNPNAPLVAHLEPSMPSTAA